MTKQNYITLFTDPDSRDQLLKIKHTINIVDTSLEDNCYLTYNPDETQELTIVLDEFHVASPLNYPDCYYCNTFEELQLIIKNLALYETTYPNDRDILGFPSEE